MGLSLDNYISIRGLQALKNAARAAKSDPLPSQAYIKPETPRVISAQGSIIDRSSSTRLSSSLSTALALSVESSPQSNRFRGEIFESPKPPDDPRLNPLLNPDEIQRQNNTRGIGERSYETTNTTPIETPLFYPREDPETFQADAVSSAFVSQDQNSASRLRGAIFSLAKEYVANNPNPTDSELQSAVDNYLGTGTGALFNVRSADSGNGESTIYVNQIEYSALGTTDKSTFDTAAANLDQFFQNYTNQRSLEGSDIQSQLSALGATLGIQGASIMVDLRKALSEPGDVTSTLDHFYNSAVDLGISNSDAERVKSIVDELKAADKKATDSFDANALMDNFTVKYQSHRYGPAYSPSTIAVNAALTANTIFLES